MAEKYKLKKTIITNNREKEVTVPHAKRFSLEEAQKWLANRKKKIGAGTFKSYEVKESGKLSLSANPPYLVAWEFQETGKKKAKKKAKAKAPKKEAKPKMSVVKGGEEPSYLIEVMVTRGGKVHKGFSGKRKRFTSFDLNKVRQDMKDMVDRSKEEGYRIIRESSNSVSLIKGDWTRRYSIVKYEQPKKRTAKKSALTKKESERKKKVEKKPTPKAEQPKDDVKRFEVGKSYYARFATSHDTISVIKVVKRTDKTLYYKKDLYPNKIQKRKIYVWGGAENVKDANYSMALIWRADHEQKTPHKAKRSALNKKETVRRSKKKVVADVKQESRFRQFEVGKSYHIDKYINPYSERYITVIKRAKKKITFTVGGYPDKYEAFIETSKNKDGSVSSEYIIFLKSEYYFADAPFSPAQN